MKYLTITLIFLVTAMIACKKEKHEGQKCSWNVILNSRVTYEWLDKPASDQVKKIEDSCSCKITVNEVCFSCGASVTTAGGIDVPCR